jgi:hypothetical protein
MVGAIIFRPYLLDYLSDGKSTEWLPNRYAEEYTPIIRST